MPAFQFSAALMLAIALAFVVVPLLRLRRFTREARVANLESNAAIFKQQRQEILREFEGGGLSEVEKNDALTELTTRAGQEVVKGIDSRKDTPGVSSPALAPASHRPWAWIAVVLLLLPIFAIGLYDKLGSPAATKMVAATTPEAPTPTDKQILAMVDSLAEKMQQNPSDPQGWMLLGRSQNALGRFEQAAQAFERANQLAPNDAQLLADYADSLAMAQGGNLEGKPFELVQQALKVDAKNKKALAIAGTAELNRRNFKVALGYWERLYKLLPEGSEDQKEVAGAMQEIRLAMGQNAAPDSVGKQSAAPTPIAAPQPATKPAANAVAGRVTIAPELAKQVTLSDTLFIFARAANWQQGGPRMPLAILRVPAKELPRDFELTDAMAMAPNVKISDFPQVVIEARVSKSGNATPQSGDLQGISAAIKPGVKGVVLVIDRVVK